MSKTTPFTENAFEALTPEAQAEILQVLEPAPAALGYSTNSRDEYSMFADVPLIDVFPEEGETEAAAGPDAPAIAAGGGEESPLAGPLGPAHNPSNWELMMEAERILEEAIAASRVTELSVFELTVDFCADILEAANPILVHARTRLEKLRQIDAGLRGFPQR